MISIIKLLTKILNYLKTTQLTLTRENNPYVSATYFARLTAYRKSGILFLRGNLTLSAAMPNETTDITIGTITGWSAMHTVLLTVPSQYNGTNVVLVQISTDGIISLYNVSGTTLPANTFYRFQAAVPMNDLDM